MTYPLASSSSSTLSPSPIRQSPLAAPPIFHADRAPSPSSKRIPYRRASQPSTPRPRLSALTCSSPTISHDPHTESPPSHPGSPPLSRSQPLLGSYQLSLLHSRMSRTTSHSVSPSSTTGFSLHLGCVGKGKTCPPDLRCPPALNIPFEARYYDLQDPTEIGDRRRSSIGASQTPWVGTVDVEQYFYDQYSRHYNPNEPGPSTSTLPPIYPGHRVAPIGQLQILVKTGSTPVKVFIVPYDLSTLPIGGRLLVREKTIANCPTPSSTPNLGDSAKTNREYLRYAIQLQFICLKSPLAMTVDPLNSSTTRRPRHSASSLHTKVDEAQIGNKEYYISKSIKLIFTASPTDSSDTLHSERHDEIIPPSDNPSFSTPNRRSSMGSLGSSPGINGGRNEEWEIVRQKWIARRSLSSKAEGEEEGDEAEKFNKVDLVSPSAKAIPLPIIPKDRGRLTIIHSSTPSRSTSSTRPTSPLPMVIADQVHRTSSPAQPIISLGSLEINGKAGETRTVRPLRKVHTGGSDREISDRFRNLDIS